MMRGIVAVSIVLAVPASAPAADPLSVQVIGAAPKATTKESIEELRKKKEALHDPYFNLQASLQKQYGKDADKWPEDKRAECQAAHDAFFEAQTDWFYSTDIKQKDIDDSVHELTQAIADKKTVRVATGPEEADLVIAVVGRAKVSDSSLGAGGAAAQLALRVTPGGRMNPAALAKAGLVWTAKRSFLKPSEVDTLHDLRPEAPYWLLISSKPGGLMPSYKKAAGQMADALGKFATDNADRLAAARKTAP